MAALHEWAEEAGSPPRSWEWSPASARSAGLMGPEESKWEREHPRWPSNTTVYHYFESWPAALEAAGIKPVWPAGPEGTLAERVEAARRMHSAGETNRAIAEVLGVRPETVSRYLRAHPCRACASPVVGDKKLCHTCSTRRGNPMRWSREEVIAAVQRWIRMEGRAPTSRDWRPRRFGGAERWEEEFGEWPPSSVARLLFGGWGRMLEAAGTTPNKPTWTPDEILVALRSYAKEFGRPPAKQELEWPPAGYPSSRTVRRHFGSFTAGLRAAGLESRKREWTRERIVEAMREFELETDRWPRSSDWLVACEDWPSASTVHNRFGSWQAGLDAAMRGWTYPPRSG
ncbi:MAG TPA: helix-turn-helix domain-containing protein [Solirubrobacterales bacterium]|nr:helix-turn-helix domain-containing protein [Solirubrobacterales bacterium]